MRRRLAALGVALLLMGGCTGGSKPPGPHSSPTPTAGGAVGSAAAAMEQLCMRPPVHLKRARPAKHVPAVITRTEREVERARGLRYRSPVAVQAVDQAGLVSGIDTEFRHSYPKEQSSRRDLAWRTIGLVPRSTTLEGAVHRFLGTRVVGYYDPASKELRYLGTEYPTPVQRYTLAHELVHALDDQYFDLSRINGIENRCRDEQLAAAVGVVEGSAVYFSSQVVNRFFSGGDRSDIASQQIAPPTGIPQFVLNQLEWPYIAGPRFIRALDEHGGLRAVNHALAALPVSTEQVLHPDRYPGDVPRPVDVPDLAAKLGAGWSDLDVEEVGEAWLADMLGLHLDVTEARPAAAGWDGGLYRAWRKGSHVAVVLRTVWDSAADAQDFRGAMFDWIQQPNRAGVVLRGDTVDVLFASDLQTFRALHATL